MKYIWWKKSIKRLCYFRFKSIRIWDFRGLKIKIQFNSKSRAFLNKVKFATILYLHFSREVNTISLNYTVKWVAKLFYIKSSKFKIRKEWTLFVKIERFWIPKKWLKIKTVAITAICAMDFITVSQVKPNRNSNSCSKEWFVIRATPTISTTTNCYPAHGSSFWLVSMCFYRVRFSQIMS